MSSDPEEENPPPLLPPATQTPTVTYTLPNPPSLIDKEDSFMDLDLDFDSSWLVDQNLFLPNPSSPLLLSILASSPTTHQNQNHLILNSSDQPTSPLWFFSDGNDEKFGGNATNSSISESFRLSDCPKLISKNESVTGNGISEEVKRRSLPPTMGLVPLDNLPSRWMIKEKMTQALRHFKESTEQTVLAQVWAPIKNGDRYVLTTSGQPFVLDPRSNGLLQYRTVSLTYMFSVDGESDGNQGLPGRVFWQRLPEWTPDVQYYSRKEYPRLNHALNYNVRGTLALPVFEPSGQSCVGVVELIMTSQRVNYATEVDKVCKALEAVNLKSSEILSNPNLQICNEGRQHALAEILEILNVVCELHKLPFAQTWVPCMHRSVLANGGGVKKSCSSFDGSCMGQVCMSTTDVAFYIVDAHMWGFRDACAEHHLQKGQGVAGRAFLSHSSYFSKDITEFCKTDYPLVHYALMFGLKSCFAICLRSIHTGIDDYILEFFLPPSITTDDEQRDLVASLMVTMKQHFRSLRVASEQDFEDEKASIEISKQEMLDSRLESCKISSPGTYNLPNDGQVKQSVSCKQKLKGESDAPQKEENNVNLDANQASASLPDNKGKKTTERRRGKTEKTISLEVLQQYFAGSLKDAAKSLGVCPTTMKRICRQHGISRWPSRKINKVNRSLSKLKLVIESVEGAEGSFNLTSLSTSPLSVAVGSISWPVCLDGGPKEQHSPVANSEFQNQKEMEATHQMANGHIETVNQIYEGETSLPRRKASHEQNGFHKKRPNGFRMATGSADDSTGNPNFHGSELPMGGMLLEDAGSSKDLSNLCNLETDGYLDERATDSNWISPRSLEQAHQLRFTTRTTPHITATQDMRNMTIKVAYRDDIIRFRLLLTSGMTELKEEVAKRLKLEVGTFIIKYLDDNQEWVVLSCDSDLQECMQIARLSGRHLIRLLVHDVLANLGSSCESTGE